MSVGLALLMAAVPAAVGPFDLSTVGKPAGAAGLIQGERELVGLRPRPCNSANPEEIVVCARRGPATSPRLPLPAERFEPGEVVRFKEAGSLGTATVNTADCSRPGSCEPSRLGETIGNIIHWLSGG